MIDSCRSCCSNGITCTNGSSFKGFNISNIVGGVITIVTATAKVIVRVIDTVM